jgi:hypothetical protein
LWLPAEFAVLPFAREKLSLPAGGRGTLFVFDSVALVLFDPPADGGRGTLFAGLPGTLARASVWVPVGPR